MLTLKEPWFRRANSHGYYPARSLDSCLRLSTHTSPLVTQ